MFTINNFSFKKKRISFECSENVVKKRLSDLKEGLNNFDNLIIYKEKKIINIYDRVCDHSGGKLISRPNNQIICPLHGWEFSPKIGKYLNAKCQKRQLNYKITDNEIIIFLKKFIPKPKSFKQHVRTKISFLNHACLLVETKNLKFATDPWIFGPAFSRGWWLSKKITKRCF